MGYVTFDQPTSIAPSSNFGRSRHSHAVIAPYLARQSVCLNSKLHFGHFRFTDGTAQARDIINMATVDVDSFDPGYNFHASDVYIITWEGMVAESWYHYRQSCTENKVSFGCKR